MRRGADRHPVSGKAVGAVNLTSWRKDACPADRAGPGHCPPGQAGPARRQQRGGVPAAAGVSAGLPVHRRVRLCANPRHGADERPGAGHARPRRPGRAPRPCSRGAGRRPSCSGGCRAANRGQRADALPPPREGQAAARWRRGPGEADRAASQAAAGAGTGSQTRMFGPALVGSGPLWLRGCGQVEAACASGEWLSLEGEPGVGKLALLRAVCRRRNRPAPSTCWTPPKPVITTGWRGRWANCSGAREAWYPARRPARPLRLRALWIALEQALAAAGSKFCGLRSRLARAR